MRTTKPPASPLRHRAHVIYGNTSLKDRERDVDGHLLPMHPQDHRKGR